MNKNNPIKIIVHHTAVSRQTQPKQFFAVDRYHRQQFGAYCKADSGYHGGYQIFIDGDGTEYRYRKDDEEGCHTKGQNTSSLGVCLAGNFDSEMPTVKQEEALQNRLKKWAVKYNIQESNIYPHRTFANWKSCYGNKLEEAWARNLFVQEKKDKELEELGSRKELEELGSRLDALRAMVLRLKILLAKFKK